MNSIALQLNNVPEYAELKDCLKGKLSPVYVTGLSAVHRAQFVHALSGELAPVLVITPDEQTAARLAEEINFFEGDSYALRYPEREFTFYPVMGVSHEYEHMRLGVLMDILKGNAKVIVASYAAATQITVPVERLKQGILKISCGDEISEKNLVERLLNLGYEYCEQVEGFGQYALRGGIIDFFPPNAKNPVRIELWGDEIDTISYFSADTQRREDNIDEIELVPAKEVSVSASELYEILEKEYENLSETQREKVNLSVKEDMERLKTGRSVGAVDRYIPLIFKERNTLLSYLKDSTTILFDGGAVRDAADFIKFNVREEIESLLTDGVITGSFKPLYEDYETFLSYTKKVPFAVMDSFKRAYSEYDFKKEINVNAAVLSVWSGEIKVLVDNLTELLNTGYRCMVLAGTKRGAVTLADDLNRYGIKASYTSDRGQLVRGTVSVCEGGLSSGLSYPKAGIAIISYGRASHILTKKRRRIKNDKNVKKIKDVADLSTGDAVVHSTHGIGIFEGIVKKEVQGVVKDYIKIRYAGTDMLYVPVTQLDLVTKYIGGKDGNVKLNKLNSLDWAKTRQRVKKAVSEMAKELIALYAKRLKTKGFPFSEDNEWQKEFEQRFEYDETDDQLKCIREIKDDMESDVPMDRLLCGDVGFGKTEVALRAVFKCVMDGKQCAVMVPTTILAWQHYQTFLRRLDGYPINVELLSRFRTPKQQKEIIKKLKTGEIDVVVGTHKLVQKDVEFKDLGLCVIDEEQRFGVAHKERFKELRTSVDVLTLSATPIPRTLNMAMSGIRDMSVITEAPQDRLPVQTYVMEYDEVIVIEAIKKELRRGGQVFYLHNRVDTIGDCVMKLQAKLPQAKIGVAHGKMGEAELSEVWKDLVEREIDILVCTTIIETGVDVPNCNTLIIEDADKMGLSQLYQLRGRVGRSERRAYAYFTFQKGRVLTDVGEKRLEAIKEFTSFGSGYRIAMRDLEIRGAGDILGSQQHGQMEQVGYDLYLKLLSDAILEEKGEKPVDTSECLVDLQIEAHIPESYIESLNQRVDIYKKIAAIENNDDYMDVIDELIDRFGDPPKSVRGLLDVALVRNSAARHGINEINQTGNYLLLYLGDADPRMIIGVVGKMGLRVTASGGERSYLRVKMARGQKPLDTINEVLDVMDSLLIEKPKEDNKS